MIKRSFMCNTANIFFQLVISLLLVNKTITNPLNAIIDPLMIKKSAIFLTQPLILLEPVLIANNYYPLIGIATLFIIVFASTFYVYKNFELKAPKIETIAIFAVIALNIYLRIHFDKMNIPVIESRCIPRFKIYSLYFYLFVPIAYVFAFTDKELFRYFGILQLVIATASVIYLLNL